MGKLIYFIIPIFFVLFVLFYYVSVDSVPVSVSNLSLDVPSRSANCSFDYLPYPDPSCSTGAIFPNLTVEDICWSGYSASVRDVSESLKNQVYESYGVYNREPYEYEIDHIIPLSIGGSNDVANLYPEKYNMTLGARDKDKVENLFHRRVCAGEMALEDAQYQIVHNWTSWI